MKTKLFLLCTLLFAMNQSFAQVTLPYYEGFNYTVGNPLCDATLGNQGPWLPNFTTNTNGDPVVVTSPFWTLPGGLAFTQTGEAVQFAGGSDDVVTEIPDQGTSGLIYASFVFKIDPDLASITDLAGGFIFSFGKVNAGLNGYNYCSAVYIRKVTDGTFNIGVSETNSTAVTSWIGGGTPTAYNTQTDYFVVIAYDIAGRLSKIWVNADITGAEPAVSADTTADGGTGSRNNIVVVRFSLEANSRTPSTIFDELRVGNTWQSVTGQAPLSVAKNEYANSVSLYPNPAKDVVRIETKNNVNVSSVEVFNLLGQSVLSQSTLKDNKINVSSLSKGLYLLKLASDKGTIAKKVVIE